MSQDYNCMIFKKYFRQKKKERKEKPDTPKTVKASTLFGDTLEKGVKVFNGVVQHVPFLS